MPSKNISIYFSFFHDFLMVFCTGTLQKYSSISLNPGKSAFSNTTRSKNPQKIMKK